MLLLLLQAHHLLDLPYRLKSLLWSILGGEGRLYQTAWPEYEEAKTVESTVEIAVQIYGKTKATISIGKDDPKDDVLAKEKKH